MERTTSLSRPNMHEIRKVEPARPLTPTERRLLDFLLRKPFPGRNDLKAQLGSVGVATECRICPTVELTVDRSSARAAPVRSRIPVEAEGVDVDGKRLHVLLHVVDGFLSELEVFREDGEPVRDLMGTESFELVHYES